MSQVTSIDLQRPRITVDMSGFDGPAPFEKKLLKTIARPKHALAHLKSALKRDKNMTDAEHKTMLMLALAEIGVANGLAERPADGE